MPNRVRLQSVSKSFGSVHALQDVDLNVEPQTMHAVVGENGAGKTTLMKVLFGEIRPDKGAILIDNQPVQLRSASDAASHRIGMVSQHDSVIPDLTCLQNLILGSEGASLLQYRSLNLRAEKLASDMNFQFDWNAEASTLSPAGRQRLEILKLLWRNSEIMILDEPTAMLGPGDADALFESMNRLIARGATVVLVTHRIPEVMEHCNYVTVMRAGKVVGDLKVSETTPQALAQLIIGVDRTANDSAVTRTSPTSRSDKPTILEVKNITIKGSKGNEAVSDASFQISPGEVVGIAGVDGNGQSELFLGLMGLRSLEKGSLSLFGSLDESASAEDRLKRGLRIIPEDRHQEAVIEAWSLEMNSALGLESMAPLAKGGWVDRSARKTFTERVLKRFETRHGGMDKPLASLSGGNQQRLVVARSLELGPKLLLAFQPVRGLDLGATANIYRAIREECDRGMAALIVSFDLDELLIHCQRILVLNGGHLHTPPIEDARSREKIGRLMVGAT